MKEPRDRAKALLRKAANDLIAADATLPTEQALDTVCFHAQQAVEKSLKAILAFHDREYPRHHDLAELLDLVKPLAPELVALEDRILRLTPYAVAVRYDDEFDPRLNEATQAFDTAAEVLRLSNEIVEQQRESQ